MLREFAVFIGFELSSDDIYNSSHRIASIKKRRRSAKHLHPIGNHRLVAVGNAVTENALILRMSVDENQHLCSSGGKSANIDAARTACTYTVAHHASTGDKHARHFLHNGGKHTGSIVGCKLFATDGVDRHGQMADVCSFAAASYNHFAHLGSVLNAFVLCLGL